MTQQRQLSPKWTNGCQPNEVEDIEKHLLENKRLFLILDEILVQKLKTNARERRSKSSYDMAAYSEFQADCNAVERTLEEVRELLKFTKG